MFEIKTHLDWIYFNGEISFKISPFKNYIQLNLRIQISYTTIREYRRE